MRALAVQTEGRGWRCVFWWTRDQTNPLLTGVYTVWLIPRERTFCTDIPSIFFVNVTGFFQSSRFVSTCPSQAFNSAPSAMTDRASQWDRTLAEARPPSPLRSENRGDLGREGQKALGHSFMPRECFSLLSFIMEELTHFQQISGLSLCFCLVYNGLLFLEPSWWFALVLVPECPSRLLIRLGGAGSCSSPCSP